MIDAAAEAGVERIVKLSAINAQADSPLPPFAWHGAIERHLNRFTVNVAGSFRRWEDYDQRHAAQYRQIVDLRRPHASRWIVAPGQGGDPDRSHYDDLLERWRHLDYLPMRFTRRDLPDE